MHKHYQSLLGTNKEIKCVSCHIGVGHAYELRNELEYQKPSKPIYKEKMKEIREIRGKGWREGDLNPLLAYFTGALNLMLTSG